LPVAGTRLKWTGRLGNMGNVAYYWTRSVPDSQLYRYARSRWLVTVLITLLQSTPVSAVIR
jgi:hypothetical protein